MSATALGILHIYPKADFFTGAAIQMRDLVAGLAARGHRVIVATEPSPIWARELARLGVSHEAIPMRRAYAPRSVWRVGRAIRRHAIDIVHAHKGRARTLTILARITGARPLLVLNRGVSFPITRVNRVGYTSRRVHAIVAVCESIKRGLVASGVPAAKIDVIYSGTDLARFHPGADGVDIRRELGLAPDAFLITQIGVRSWRGWRDLLDAMREVAPSCTRARMLFVGAPAPRIAQLADEARERGLGGRVLALGHRQDVPAILAASDVVVDASYAGLGITGSIREALACERPVIATDLEGMPELVTNGETGLLVPPRDVKAMAAAMLRVIGDPAMARAMARAGRKRVEARFSMSAKIDATEALYRRLLEGGRAA